MITVYLSMLETEEERVQMAKIYEEHEPYMLRYATAMLKDKYAAEDAVHNAFLSIIKHKDNYFTLSCRDFRALSVIIVKSKCIDYLRHKNNVITEQLEDIEPYLESNDMPVEQQVIIDDEYSIMLKHMRALDEISRTVLEMKYILGMSYKEIAQELGTTPKHIDTRIQRAKDKLRKSIAAGGESGEH